MATFKLFGNLEPLVNGNQPLAFDSATVRAAIEEMTKRYPSLVGELTHANGEFNRYYSVLVNGEMIEFLDDLETKLSSNDEITIFPPTAA